MEFVKLMPGIGVFVESYRGYKDKLKEIYLEKFLNKLSEKLTEREDLFSDKFYKTDEGKQFSIRIFDIATECQYFEKIDFFINVLINRKENFSNSERLRFVELIKNISMPILIIFANIINNFKNKGIRIPDILSISRELDMDPYLIDSCLHELKSQGIISENIGWGGPGNQKITIASGESGITAFTMKFYIL